MADDEPRADEPDEEGGQYGGTESDIDATEQTERAEAATDEDEDEDATADES